MYKIPSQIPAELASWIAKRLVIAPNPNIASVGLDEQGKILLVLDPEVTKAPEETQALVLLHECLHVLRADFEKKYEVPALGVIAEHSVMDWTLCGLSEEKRRLGDSLIKTLRPGGVEMFWQDEWSITVWPEVARLLELDPSKPPPSSGSVYKMLLEKFPPSEGGIVLPTNEGEEGEGEGEGGQGEGEEGEKGHPCIRQGGQQTIETELERGELISSVLKSAGSPGLDKLVEAAKNASPSGFEQLSEPKIVLVEPKVLPELEFLLDEIESKGGTRKYRKSYLREGRTKELPSRSKLPTKLVAVAVDSSFSVDDKLTELFTAVIRAHFEAAKFAEFSDQVVEVGEEWLGRTIGGGTLYEPVFEWANEVEADVLVVFTDGLPADSGIPFTRCPIIWAIPKGMKLNGWKLRPEEGDSLVEIAV